MDYQHRVLLIGGPLHNLPGTWRYFTVFKINSQLVRSRLKELSKKEYKQIKNDILFNAPKREESSDLLAFSLINPLHS